jgi:hypothetical protein
MWPFGKYESREEKFSRLKEEYKDLIASGDVTINPDKVFPIEWHILCRDEVRKMVREEIEFYMESHRP